MSFLVRTTPAPLKRTLAALLALGLLLGPAPVVGEGDALAAKAKPATTTDTTTYTGTGRKN